MYFKLSLCLLLMMGLSASVPVDNIYSKSDVVPPDEFAENKALVKYIGGIINYQNRISTILKHHMKVDGAKHKKAASNGIRAISDSNRKLSALRSKASKLELSSKGYKALLAEANKQQASTGKVITDIIDDIWDWWNGPEPPEIIPSLPRPDCNSAGIDVTADCNMALQILKNCESGDLSGGSGLDGPTCTMLGQMERMECMMAEGSPNFGYSEPRPNMAAEAAALCQAIDQIIFQEQGQKTTADGN